MTKIIIYICRAGGGSTDVSVYKDDQVDTRSDGIQRICAYHLFTGLSPSAQSCQLSPWTTSAMVRVSNDDNNNDRFYALHAFVAAVLVVPSGAATWYRHSDVWEPSVKFWISSITAVAKDRSYSGQIKILCCKLVTAFIYTVKRLTVNWF